MEEIIYSQNNNSTISCYSMDFSGISKQNAHGGRNVCRRVLIFSWKVLKDRGKADTMSASAKPCVHSFWRTWMARVGDPVMMRATVSLFIRKFTPGDVTSRRDVPFAVGVRGVYGNPTLRAMHSIHKCVAKDAPHLFHWRLSSVSVGRTV